MTHSFFHPLGSYISKVLGFLLVMFTLRVIVFLGKFLISQKLGVHSSCRNVLGSLLLLDAIGVCLLRVVVSTRVLLL